MKVNLKCPIRIGKDRFAKGENEIPESLMDHWFVQALLKSGDMSLVEAQAGSPAEAKPKAPKSAKAAKPAPQPHKSAS
jgi:hypothetical protein